MTKLGQDLIKAATEAVQIAKGEAEPARVWGCGWVEKTNRCIRFNCHKCGPCDGYQGQ